MVIKTLKRKNREIKCRPNNKLELRTSGKSGFREKMNIVVHFAVPGKVIWAANSLCIAVPVKNPSCLQKNDCFRVHSLKINYFLKIVNHNHQIYGIGVTGTVCSYRFKTPRYQIYGILTSLFVALLALHYISKKGIHLMEANNKGYLLPSSAKQYLYTIVNIT